MLSENPVTQGFVAPQDGLSTIELLLVVPQGAPDLPSRPIHWELVRAGDQKIAEGVLETSGLPHNTPLRFEFGPLADSGGQTYEIRLRAPAEGGIALWASRDDTLVDGRLFPQSGPQNNDLWLRLTATATPLTLVTGLGEIVERWRDLLLWLPLVLFAPGALLALLLRPRDPAAEPDALGPPILALGLTFAAIPLFYLWLEATGIMLTADLLRVLLQASGLGVALLAVRQWPRTQAWLGAVIRSGPAILVFVLILLAAAVSRFAAVEDVVLPLWIDGVHHTMVVQLFQQQGMLPHTYRPFLPIDQFVYHFGFHALAAVHAEVSQQPAPQTVLFWGQLVNVAVLPGIFLLARRLARSTWAGLWALTVPLIALMPAYFTTWGRYTQLFGLAMLPIALDAALEWLQRPGFWRTRSQFGRLAIATLLGAGLVVVHYRVLVFYATFLGLYLLLIWLNRQEGEVSPKVQTSRLVLLALTVVALSAPWLLRLWSDYVAQVVNAGALASPPEYNHIPVRFLTIDITRWLFVIAAGGLVVAGIARRRVALLLALWVGVLALVANLGVVGLRPLWLINNESLVISYWLPTALASGIGLGLLTKWALGKLPRGAQAVGAVLVTAILLSVCFYGAWWRADIINDVTILATEADVRAAEWVERMLPSDAKFLINSRFWQGNVYTGSDGGYWLPLLTRRETTLPPAHYFYADEQIRDQINDLARTISEVDNLDDPALRERLKALGVTHVYLGARGGSLKVERLQAQPALREVYQSANVHIFELLP